MSDMGETVGTRKPSRKRKERGIIRQRTWVTPDGTTKACWQADFGTVNGKRKMKSFAVKADAENWLREQRLILDDQGHAAFALTDAQRVDAVKAMESLNDVEGLPFNAALETAAKTYRDCWHMLRDTGGRIEDACRFYVKHHPKAAQRRTVQEVVEAYEKDAIEHGLRPASIRDIRQQLRGFSVKYGTRMVGEITKQEAATWARTMPDLSATSKKHNRVILHGLFEYAIDQSLYGAENPFASKRHRRSYREDERMPECMPWRDVQKMMAAASTHDTSMVPSLAIGFFSGLRVNEIRLLDWQQIDLVARRITVMPEVAKKRRARHVQIEDNLLAWLAPYKQESGPVTPEGEKWRSRLDAVREKAGVTWPRNCMRHSFASHHLIKYGDAVKTAMQLGHHRDTSMLFEHYRALVTVEDAAAYWRIKPEAEANTLRFPAAG